jgi:putative SOS response-associated peptidase YedK
VALPYHQAMCGRFTREFTWAEVHDFLDVVFPGPCIAEDEEVPAAGPSWNVAPTQSVLVARGRRPEADPDAPLAARVGLESWGFTPGWMRSKGRPGPINARGETVATTPMFRSAFARQRCVVPMSSFYEWQAREGSRTKQPWRFHRTDGTILLVAAVRTRGDDEAGPTVALITTSPNRDVADVHDRMPLILDPADVPRWCDPATASEDAAALIGPAPDGTLTAHPVSTRVNRPAVNDASLIVPAEVGAD